MSGPVIPIYDHETGVLCGHADLHNNTFAAIDRNGQVHNMSLGQGDVHIERALANYASGFSNAQGCADIAMPPVLVANASDRYWEWDKDDAFQAVDGTVVSPGANVREVSARLSSNRFQTKQYALGAFVPTEVTANADAPLQIILQDMRRVMAALHVNREIRVADIMLNSANYSGNRLITLGAGAKWNGGASSDPIANIQQIMEAMLMPASGMIMDLTTWNWFTRNPAVQKFTTFKTAAPPIPGADQRDMFASLLNIPKPHVCQMRRKNMAVADSYPFVWANDVVVYHRPDGGGLPLDGRDVATGYTFRWTGGTVEGATVEGGWMIRSFFNPYRGARGGTQIIVTHNDAEQFISGFVGGLIKGAIQ